MNLQYQTYNIMSKRKRVFDDSRLKFNTVNAASLVNVWIDVFRIFTLIKLQSGKLFVLAHIQTEVLGCVKIIWKLYI